MQRIDTSLKPVRRRLGAKGGGGAERIFLWIDERTASMRAGILITHAIPPPSFLLSNHPHQPPDIYNNMRAAKYVGVNRERERWTNNFTDIEGRKRIVSTYFFPRRTRKSLPRSFSSRREESREQLLIHRVKPRTHLRHGSLRLLFTAIREPF